MIKTIWADGLLPLDFMTARARTPSLLRGSQSNSNTVMNSYISPSGRQTCISPPHFIHREIQPGRGRLMHRCRIYESDSKAHRLQWSTFSNNTFRRSWQLLTSYTAFHLKLEKYFSDEEIGEVRSDIKMSFIHWAEQTQNIQYPKHLPSPSEGNNGEPADWTPDAI